MDKLRLAIRDRDGQDIVNPDLLTGQIKKSGLSIDGTKLYGSDNFIIDARRLKCDIKLVNNSRINDTLISNLTNESLLVEDNITSTELPVAIFSKDRLREVFSEDKLFYRNKNFPDGQTWSTENLNTGRLVIQSHDLAQIIYTAIKKYAIYTVDGLGYSGQNSYSEDGITFKYGMQNIISFLVRGLKLHYNRPLNDIDTDYTAGKMFINYLNEIDNRYIGFGNRIKNYVNSCTFDGYFTAPHQFDIESDFSNQMYVFPILLKIVKYMATQGAFDGFVYIYPQDEMYDLEVPFGLENIDDYTRLSIFISSIVQYNWYQSVNAEWVNSGFNQLSMGDTYVNVYNFPLPDSPEYDYWQGTLYYWQYIPFYLTRELIYRYLSCANIMYCNDIVNVFLSNPGINQILQNRNLTCVDSPIKELMFGKVQTATVEDELPSGVPIVNNWGTLTEMFNPVERYFKIDGISTEYKFYLDNIALGSETKSTNSYLGMTGFDEFNWMYFDKITCYEELSDTIFVDNYPMYDEDGDETDEYGLYLYSDFFNKYYTKTKSNLMDLYVYLYSGNNLIYSGIIDYTTVVHNVRDNNLSFEATDAIGVLIENLRKLSSFINFSQFDIGDMITADPRAGSTIGQFIKTVINNPLPYNTALNGTIDQDTDMDGFNNKVLEEISAEDAFIIGVQMSKKLLLVNQSTGKIELQTINESVTSTTIADEAIISLEYQQEVGGDVFSIDKLKKVAGFDKIAPSIAAYYNSVMLKYRKTISLELFMQDNDINVLDRIFVRNKYYIVMSINYDIVSRKIRVTATEIR